MPGEPNLDQPGMCFEPPRIRYGNNGGYQAINLAIHFGVSRVILTGFDMGFSGKRRHWHDDHAGRLSNPQDYNFETWRRYMAEAAPGIAAHGVQVINCSRRTALECFSKAPLADVL